MKRIEAFIKPGTAEAVRTALFGAGVEIIRMADVTEHSNPDRTGTTIEDSGDEPDDRARVWLVAHVANDKVGRITGLIRTHAQTSTPLDGSIIVSNVEHVHSLNQRN